MIGNPDKTQRLHPKAFFSCETENDGMIQGLYTLR